MEGQWLGLYTGTVEGNILINIDRVDKHYEFVAYLKPFDNALPSSAVYIVTDSLDKTHKATGYINPIDPVTFFQTNWESVGKYYPDISNSKTADVTIIFSGDSIEIAAMSDIGVAFNAKIQKAPVSDESKIKSKKMNWDEFKSYISTLAGKDYIFRGQERPWRLVTSYHRRKRYRVNTFVANDVKKLHQRLSAITPHFFDLTVPEQNGAFFNLLQHHGYPTPLLDWSHSPYVAAFFAFKGIRKNYDGDGNIRLFIFNKQMWLHDFQQIMVLDPPFAHLSITEFIAIANPRMVPQQAVTTATNIDDIEEYILQVEKMNDKKYIDAIDIPARCREEAMLDLQYMGITAGSMFPGLDGICEELREYNFG